MAKHLVKIKNPYDDGHTTEEHPAITTALEPMPPDEIVELLREAVRERHGDTATLELTRCPSRDKDCVLYRVSACMGYVAPSIFSTFAHVGIQKPIRDAAVLLGWWNGKKNPGGGKASERLRELFAEGSGKDISYGDPE